MLRNDWRGYDSIWLPDDDTLTSQRTLNAVFEAADRMGLQLFAPALQENSYYGHHVTMRNRNFFARRVGKFRNPDADKQVRDESDRILGSHEAPRSSAMPGMICSSAHSCAPHAASCGRNIPSERFAPSRPRTRRSSRAPAVPRSVGSPPPS
jgi:hypothetical protein